MEGGSVQISLDKLPVKRLDSIEENGAERFPTYDVGYDEKRVSLIRRIDFAWAVEREEEDLDGEEEDKDGDGSRRERRRKKKAKKKESSGVGGAPWQWQGMVENLQLAHQELQVIIDLIRTVEANDLVNVAGMTRPKLLPNEMLADYSVSVANKLQCYRQLGKYFKQSAKALEQQVAREAKFYGALIRLQQNWKVKRQRVASNAPSNEGFTIDLSDNSVYDITSVSRPSALSTIRVDHDSAGMLAIKLPPNSCRSLRFGILGAEATDNQKKFSELRNSSSIESSSEETDKESGDDECVKSMHLLLREVHQAIFAEQVFDMVNRGAFNQSFGVNVTGMRENYLRLGIGTETSVFISLAPSSQKDQLADTSGSRSYESSVLPLDSLKGVTLPDEKEESATSKRAFLNSISYEIYLQQLFHEHMFPKPKGRPLSARLSGQPAKDGAGLLSHFCLSLAHGMFASKVIAHLEDVVYKVPFLRLISHPTWHSRTSSWTIFMKVPRSILHGASQPSTSSDAQSTKSVLKSEFRTKVVVSDDCITVEAEGSSNILGLFKGSSDDLGSVNKYNCDLANLPVIILEQVASQVIGWLHEEAQMVGIKVNRNFLCLSFELEQGETLSLAAQVDPDDAQGCIGWWLVMEDGFADERKLQLDMSDGTSEYRKFLGSLSLDVLYSTLIDLVSLCNGGGNA